MIAPDLNLLLVFDAVMRERNLRRAAILLNRSQPAVSQAVARLRENFADQLFRRLPTGVEPTPRAEALWAEIEEPLSRLREQVAPESFDPLETRQCLRIGLADDVQILAFAELVSVIRAKAPHVVVAAIETDHQSVWSQVRSGLIDLGATVAPPPPRGLAGKVLLNQHFVVVHRADKMPPLNVEAYLERQHVAFAFSDGRPGYVDLRLEELGRSRTVIASTPRFTILGDLVIQTGAIATVPEAVARFLLRSGGLKLAPCPFDLIDVPVRLAWHLRRQADPFNRWARQQVETVISNVMRG